MAKKPTLNISIPVYNEQAELRSSVETLVSFLRQNLTDFDWTISVVDNASTDQTFTIAKELASRQQRVRAIHLPKKGRGLAVKYAWHNSTADVVAYLDVDLSTDLKHLPPLVRSLRRGYDIAIGTRNAAGARVYGRYLLRTITSKGYIALIKCFFWAHFSDAQCGFKAVTREIVNRVVVHTEDNEWFFDTELLLLAEKLGYRIYEEPVTWRDNPGSTVRVWKTAIGDLKGLWRMFWRRPWRRLMHARG